MIKTLTYETIYHDWGLYDLIIKQPQSEQVMTSYFIASRICEHFQNKKVSVLEPCSGAYSYFADFIKSLVKTINQSVSIKEYECIEFINYKEHGDNVIIGSICDESIIKKLGKTYDVVFVPYGSLACLGDFNNISLALSIIKKLLKPSGIFIVSTNKSCTEVMPTIIRDKTSYLIDIQVDSYFAKEHSLNTPNTDYQLSFKSFGYYDRQKGTLEDVYEDMMVLKNNKPHIKINFKQNNIINTVCEPELVRYFISNGWNMKKASFWGYDEVEGYKKLESKEYDTYSSADYFVLKK